MGIIVEKTKDDSIPLNVVYRLRVAENECLYNLQTKSIANGQHSRLDEKRSIEHNEQVTGQRTTTLGNGFRQVQVVQRQRSEPEIKSEIPVACMRNTS